MVTGVHAGYEQATDPHPAGGQVGTLGKHLGTQCVEGGSVHHAFHRAATRPRSKAG